MRDEALNILLCIYYFGVTSMVGRAFARHAHPAAIRIAQPDVSGSFFRPPLQESLFTKEQPVSFFEGGVGKTYGGKRIVFIDPEAQSKFYVDRPGFHKFVADPSAKTPLTKGETEQFKRDVNEAAPVYSGGLQFIRENPELQL